MMAASTTAAKKPAPRLRFLFADDLALLREVNAQNPFRDPAQWTVIAKNIHFASGKHFSARALRERLDLLLAQFITNDRASLRKSGTEEEYEEKDKLLQEIWDLAKEFGYKIKARKTQLIAAEREFSNEVRNFACDARAASSSHDGTCSPPASSASGTAETASYLLQQIGNGTQDEIPTMEVDTLPASPQTMLDTSTTDATIITQGADVQEEPAATVESRRKKRKPKSLVEDDHEFLEKRWCHERALKEKDTQVERERIALERLHLEMKQERWQKRQEMKMLKIEQKYKMRELELEARANELRERQRQTEVNNASQQAIVNVLNVIAHKMCKE